MFSSLWSTIQLHRYLLVFRAFLNAPYSHICHKYNAKHKIIVLTLAWGRLRCPRRSGQETCYPFHLVLKIFVFCYKWQLTTSRGSLAKRSTSFRLEYIPRASALGKSILWVALIWLEQMPPSSLHIHTQRASSLGETYIYIKIHSHSSLSSFFCKQPCTHYS